MVRDDGSILREGSQALDRGGKRDKTQKLHCIMHSPIPLISDPLNST